MRENKNQNKLATIAIKQNLLLWELSKSFLDVEKKIFKALGETFDEKQFEYDSWPNGF